MILGWYGVGLSWTLHVYWMSGLVRSHLGATGGDHLALKFVPGTTALLPPKGSRRWSQMTKPGLPTFSHRALAWQVGEDCNDDCCLWMGRSEWSQLPLAKAAILRAASAKAEKERPTEGTYVCKASLAACVPARHSQPQGMLPGMDEGGGRVQWVRCSALQRSAEDQPRPCWAAFQLQSPISEFNS